MPTVHVNGATIAYNDTGAPEGKPDAPVIVFGHGLLFSGWMFHHQVKALRDRYRCITIDWRGQGDTPPAASGYDMETLSDDAIALIEQLGVAPVHYVGLSMGGFVGQRVAARRGDLLRSLTLLDTSPDEEHPAVARQHKALAVVYRLAGITPVRNKVLPLMFGPSFLAAPESKTVIDEWARQLGRSTRRGVYKAVLGVANRGSVLAELARVNVPTLVVVGADDAATPPVKAERIVERIAGARLEVLEDSGHSCTLEKPAQLNQLLDEFLVAADNRAA